MKHWVIGKGGLLGSSMDQILSDPRSAYQITTVFNWTSKINLYRQIDNAVNQFSQYVGNDKWSIYWCAGAGTVRSSEGLLEQETNAIEQLLRYTKKYFEDRLANGQFFFASSIGAMYSGSSQHPIDEQTEAAPAGLYGRQKQKIENLLFDFAIENNCSLLIGRIANLYGSNQDLAKNQGLISTICKAKILRQPLSIYSELDTVRNYIYADDAARQIVRHAVSSDTESTEKIITRLIASKHNYSISAVLKEAENVFGEPVDYSLRTNPDPEIYPRNLSVRIRKYEIQTEIESVSLAVGIKNIRNTLMSAHQMGRLLERKVAV